MKTAAERQARLADDFDSMVESAFLLAVMAGAQPEALIGGLAATLAGLMARELTPEARAELLEAFCNAFNLKVAL